MAKPTPADKPTLFDKIKVRVLNSKAGVAAAIVVAVVGVGAVFIKNLGDIVATIRPLSTADEAWVSMTCRPEQLPLTSTAPLWGVLLHPRWKNNLQSVPVSTIPRVWPTGVLPGIGFQCEIKNGNDQTLYGLLMPFDIIFHDPKALLPDRTVEIGLPDTIEAGKALVLHIGDDTNWSPEVILPIALRARLGSESEPRLIRVRQGTTNGLPMRLKGFGPGSDDEPRTSVPPSDTPSQRGRTAQPLTDGRPQEPSAPTVPSAAREPSPEPAGALSPLTVFGPVGRGNVTSFNQRGGITAGEVNIRTGVAEPRITFEEDGRSNVPKDGHFESWYKLHVVTPFAIPTLQIQARAKSNSIVGLGYSPTVSGMYRTGRAHLFPDGLAVVNIYDAHGIYLVHVETKMPDEITLQYAF